MLFGMGALAGILTTVAGLGGGMALVLVLTLMWGAPTALAVSTPALLVGNVHRAYLYRAQLDRDVARRFSLGVVPGAIVGGLLTAAIPPMFLNVMMLLITSYAIARALGWVRWQPSRDLLTPAGAGIGIIAATSGGGAVLTAPVLMATGLSGDRYLATVAVASVALHSARILGYGLGGLIGAETLERSAVLALAILAGNHIGQRLRAAMSERAGRALEVATLGVCTLLALVGIA